MKTTGLFFLVLLNIVAVGFVGCTDASKDSSSTSPASTAPAEGTLVFSSKTATSMTVTWPAATSSISTAAQLQYQLVYSGSAIATLAAAQAATVSMAYATATLTSNVAGLTQGTPYYFAVLVKDTSGNVGYATGSANTLCSGKIMFIVQNASSGGALGGSAGADTICTTNKPGGSSSTFKALISDDARRACYISGNDSCLPAVTTGRTNWVLAASTNYCTADYSGFIGTTSSAAYLTNGNAGVLTANATNFFTGMNIYWGESTANNCSNWTNAGGSNPVTGDASKSGSGWVSAGTGPSSCGTVSNLVCVEQ